MAGYVVWAGDWGGWGRAAASRTYGGEGERLKSPLRGWAGGGWVGTGVTDFVGQRPVNRTLDRQV